MQRLIFDFQLLNSCPSMVFGKPLMIGEQIPRDHPNWMNFLLLLTIMDITFAPVTTADVITYLREVINDHHTGFQELYPDSPITPKMHYMIHIPEWMLKYTLLYASSM